MIYQEFEVVLRNNITNFDRGGSLNFCEILNSKEDNKTKLFLKLKLGDKVKKNKRKNFQNICDALKNPQKEIKICYSQS